MTTQIYEVVVTVVVGDAREVSRTFRSGALHAPLSVGSRGDWIVSAEGVAIIHLWLQFDGARLYVSNVEACAMTYVQDLPVGNNWHEVADGSELRFGQARMSVFFRPAELWAPTAAPALAAGHVEPRRLTPIERAAALPLPLFFRDRLRAASEASPGLPELRRARSSPLPRAISRNASRAASRTSRALPWVALATVVGAALLIVFVARGMGRHADFRSAAPSASAAAPPPEIRSPRFGESPSSALPPTPLPAPEVTANALSTVPGPLPATKPLSEPTPKPYRQNVADAPVPRIGAEPWLISEEWREHHERQLRAPNRARAKVVFLGDSITEGWGMSPAYRDSFGKYTPLNLGLAGDFTQNVLWRIEHGALTGTNPEVLVLMIGVNNIAGGFSAQDTVRGIRAIVAAVQAHLPNARVLLLAILPAHQNPTDPVRLRIVEADRLLANLAAPPRVDFHDVGSLLLEPDGTLSKATAPDFIHPTAAAYVRLSTAVVPLIDALMAHAAE